MCISSSAPCSPLVRSLDSGFVSGMPRICFALSGTITLSLLHQHRMLLIIIVLYVSRAILAPASIMKNPIFSNQIVHSLWPTLHSRSNKRPLIKCAVDSHYMVSSPIKHILVEHIKGSY